MINCRILIEGIDVPSCDGCYLTYETLSELTLIQTLGRAIRKFEGKTKAMYMFGCDYNNQIVNKIRKFDKDVNKRLQ